MGDFSKVSSTAFEDLQFDAGTLLRTFDPENPVIEDDAIICLTTGGITATCVPTFVDDGADIDNVPDNMLEFKRITSYTATLGFTALSVSASAIKLSLGAADTSDVEGVTKITPRMELKETDFEDIWWVGDIKGGKMAAVQLKKALSTGGFSLKTTKAGKGNLSVTLTGHYSIKAQDEVPMDFYIGAPATEEGA
jgi:hypothetical protein